MSMNIQQVMRAVLGDAAPAEPKLLELKVGQIVKGMVLQLLAEHEALMNVGGAHVRAKLETPLAKGQIALLQVQPDTGNGVVMLKPLHPSTGTIQAEGAGEALKALGLKDTPEMRQLVQDMHRIGVPVTKENLQSAQQAVRQLAAPGSAVEADTQSALLAMKRGLPLTQETLGALKQLISGEPIDQLLGKLKSQLAQLTSGEQQGAKAGGTQTGASLVSRLEPLLARVEAFGLQLTGADVEGEEVSQRGTPARPQHEGAPEPRHRVPPEPTPAAMQRAQSERPQEAATRSELSGGGTNSGAAIRQSAGVQPPIVRQLMQTLGLDYERLLAKALDKSAPAGTMELAPGRPEGLKQPAAESMKQLLLSIVQSGDGEIPAAIKETASQLAQHITGQQLLATPDRSSPLMHVTLFVPILDKNGQQTASIQIQSRKGERGALDGSNCRLLFDLRMNTLGDTVVEVQVIDRLVGLHIHNDYPGIPTLMDSMKPLIQRSLEQIGYQFLSMKVSEFPKSIEPAANEPSQPGVEAALKFSASPYRGVDLRI